MAPSVPRGTVSDIGYRFLQRAPKESLQPAIYAICGFTACKVAGLNVQPDDAHLVLMVRQRKLG